MVLQSAPSAQNLVDMGYGHNRIVSPAEVPFAVYPVLHPNSPKAVSLAWKTCASPLNEFT